MSTMITRSVGKVGQIGLRHKLHKIFLYKLMILKMRKIKSGRRLHFPKRILETYRDSITPYYTYAITPCPPLDRCHQCVGIFFMKLITNIFFFNRKRVLNYISLSLIGVTLGDFSYKRMALYI